MAKIYVRNSALPRRRPDLPIDEAGGNRSSLHILDLIILCPGSLHEFVVFRSDILNQTFIDDEAVGAGCVGLWEDC